MGSRQDPSAALIISCSPGVHYSVSLSTEPANLKTGIETAGRTASSGDISEAIILTVTY